MRARLMIATGLLAVAGLGTTLPSAAATRILTIFGNDKCPTSNGEEIVVCTRKPEGDRFRIPETLRQSNDASPSAQARVNGMRAVDNGTIGTCSASGPGGQTGCELQAIRAAAAERRAKKAPDIR